MAKKIKIRVYPDGRIESETVGIKGKSCLGYIKEIEQLTDAQVIHSEFTDEYYQCSVMNNEYSEEQQQSGY